MGTAFCSCMQVTSHPLSSVRRLTTFLDNNQLASKGLAQLLDAGRSCDMHTKALALVKTKVDRHQTHVCGMSHAEYLKAAHQLQSDH